MSLFGLSLTLNQLSGDFLEENNELWTPLLSENRLWKLNKHQNPSVSRLTEESSAMNLKCQSNTHVCNICPTVKMYTELWAGNVISYA